DRIRFQLGSLAEQQHCSRVPAGAQVQLPHGEGAFKRGRIGLERRIQSLLGDVDAAESLRPFDHAQREPAWIGTAIDSIRYKTLHLSEFLTRDQHSRYKIGVV